jgi:RsiW-degrading membrane proteinase PrsW (M82 family)
MSLGWKLFIVFIAFVAILTVVIYFAFRERKVGKGLAEDDIVGQQASDARVLTVIFSAIFGGMLLTLLVAWLVFF